MNPRKRILTNVRMVPSCARGPCHPSSRVARHLHMTLGQAIKKARVKLGTIPVGWFLLAASGLLAIWAGWEPIYAFLSHPHQPNHVAIGIAAGCLAFIGTGLLMARRVARMNEITNKSRGTASGKQDEAAGTAGYPKTLVQVAGHAAA